MDDLACVIVVHLSWPQLTQVNWLPPAEDMQECTADDGVCNSRLKNVWLFRVAEGNDATPLSCIRRQFGPPEFSGSGRAGDCLGDDCVSGGGFVNRLGAIAPAIAVAGQMELEVSIRTVSSASSTSPTVFQLNAGQGQTVRVGERPPRRWTAR